MKLKKILSLILCAIMLFSLSVPVFATSDDMKDFLGFDDVSKNHWAYSSIITCVDKGAIKGTRSVDENGFSSYQPNGNVTLGQFLAVITRLVCPDMVEYYNYSDFTSVHWAYPNYMAAETVGLIDNGEFDKNKEALDSALSREDMAYILVNTAKYNGEKLEIIDEAQAQIDDFESISDSRKECVLMAYSNCLLMGDTQYKFNPKNNMTRAEMAVVVCRLMKYIERPEFESRFIYKDAEGKVRVKDSYGEENAKAFFDTALFFEDKDGKLGLSFVCPTLPKVLNDNGFKYTFVVSAYDEDGNHLESWSKTGLKSDEEYNATLKTWDAKTVKVSDIETVVLVIRLESKDGYTLEYKTSSNWVVGITSKLKGSDIETEIPYNATHIYKDLDI